MLFRSEKNTITNDSDNNDISSEPILNSNDINTIGIDKIENVVDELLQNNFNREFKSSDDINSNKEINFNNIGELEEVNISLDVEDLDTKQHHVEEEDPSILKEVDFSTNLNNDLETLTLKKPNQVYYEIYQKAREKAKEAKKTAISAYLEMKNIKKTYMLDDMDDSDSEFEDLSDRDSSSEISDNESLENDF